MKLILSHCSDSARAFVADSFVRSYQGGDGPLSEVEASPRARAMRAWLDRHWADVRVMTGEGAPDLFLGWVLVDFAADGWPAWYAYVKHDLRNHGLCREAFRMLGCTHVRLITRAWQEKWNHEQARKSGSLSAAAATSR